MKLSGRRMAVMAAGIVVVAVGLLAVRPGVDGGDDPGSAGSMAATSGNRAATPATAFSAHGSPVQLPTPYAYRDAGQEMFVLGAPTAAAKPGDDYPVQVQLNRAGAERAAATPDGALDVTLPDGRRYPVKFERVESGHGGNWTWIGRVESPLGQLAAVLTYGRDGVFGVLPAPDGQLFQVQTSNGQAYLQPDPGLVPPGVDPSANFPDFVIPASSRSLAPAASQAVQGLKPGAPVAVAGVINQAETPWTGMLPLADGAISTIDVLGVYTTNLVQERGSISAAETEFVNLLSIANQAHIDSGTVARFELVGLVETDYPGATFNDTALSELRTNNMHDGLDIHAKRDALGADLVAMLRPYAAGDATCGIAYLISGSLGGTSAYSGSGFSVSSCGAYTMAHELGHNLGSAHDRETATGWNGALQYGAFEYSFGYRQSTPTNFATIMAYTQPGQPRLGYFSAPGNMLCLGSACGIVDQSDNVRSISQMAETVSRFRDPPNTISVMDVKLIEPADNHHSLTFQIRLTTPAPAGGVHFDIATVDGGTATPWVDFVPGASSQTIAEGQVLGFFSVSVIQDDLVEQDETVLVRLSNVSGVTVYDGEATGLIWNDDPRVRVSGSVLFPSGKEPPSSFYIVRSLNFDGKSEHSASLVSSPDYKYETQVVKGASNVRLHVSFDDGIPWLDTVVDVGTVDSDTLQDVTVEAAELVSGRLRWAEDSPAPTNLILVYASNVMGDGSGSDYSGAWPPDYRFVLRAKRGAALGLSVTPPSPYVSQRVEISVDSDMEQDIILSAIPSLTIAHQRIEEGAAGTSRTVAVEVRLSTAAPPSGVTFDLGVENGNAANGSDYQFEPKSLTIPAYSSSVWTTLVIQGDDLPEQDEEFRIVARDVQGAHMPSPGVIRILNDDERPATNDFDNDGQSELLWRHGGTGRAALWGGAQYARAWNLTSVRDLGWRIVGTGDFDRDHKADLLWRHLGHGRNTIWRSGDSGTQLAVAPLEDVNWEVAGVGDFDGDLQSDVLWHHRTTGSNMIWPGGDARASRPVTRITDTDWRIAAVADFDGDGHADILWRHARIGANVIWLKGDNRSQQKVGGVTDQDWVVAGAGDFNGDGKDDVLWTDLATGNSVIWHSGDRADQRSLTRVTDLAWDIVAVGDYDGNGIADAVWRNGTTGRNAVWLGGDYRDQLPVVGVRDTNWGIVH